MRTLRYFLIGTDTGFIVYWLITALHLLPSKYLYPEYDNPVLVAWNWSFLPLDLLISLTGFCALLLYRRGSDLWRSVALLSLALTTCSGLQAVGFWAMRCQFDPLWWLPNLFLMLYPLFFLPGLLQPERKATA